MKFPPELLPASFKELVASLSDSLAALMSDGATTEIMEKLIGRPLATMTIPEVVRAFNDVIGRSPPPTA